MSTPPPTNAPDPSLPTEPQATPHAGDPNATRYSDPSAHPDAVTWAVRTPPATPAPAAGGIIVPGYEILGELGRGGMGAVFRGHDPAFDRDLAVKVLLENPDDPEAMRRFLEEARISGQLQHPGVVPIYAMGRLPDRRPYFTMKLIEGRTLAQLLKERKSPDHDLPRFLKAFEQVCQTVAYAHSRGVIHRDLKPLNIMVGAFGEVQVMDWGLAKMLGRSGESAGPAGAAPSAGGSCDRTEVGAVLGTPTYMPPEQARGEVDRLDERCDVFGLGAVLCTILTGRPPYTGANYAEILIHAEMGELTDAFARLDASGADADLVRLAKACLAPEPAGRPRDAGAVAEALTAHLAGVQERLRAAETAWAVAQAKSRSERRARLLTVGLAATVLLAVTAGGAGALWVQQDRATRAADDARQTSARAAADARREADQAAADARRDAETAAADARRAADMAAVDARLAAEHARKAAITERDVTAALDEAATLGKEAQCLKADPARWEAALAEALAAVKRAEVVLDGGEGAAALRPRVDAQRHELEEADGDRRTIAQLEDARLQRAAVGREGGFDKAGAAAGYADAFRDMHIDGLAPEEAAARINRRPIRADLLAALDDWAVVAPNPEEADRLRAIADAADPDPTSFRNRCRALLDRKDWDGVRDLAFGPEGRAVPTARLASVARQLLKRGAAAEAVAFLKEADDRRPGDFWVLAELALSLQKTSPPATDEAIRYYTAALALRPRSAVTHNNLGAALHEKGRPDEAIAEYGKALELNPDDALTHNNLGAALHERGRPDEAIKEYGKAVQLVPDFADAHYNLGRVLYDRRRWDEAIIEDGKAVALRADFADAHYNLALALRAGGRTEDAIAEYRALLKLKPDHADAHYNLGVALGAVGRPDEAITEYRRVVELKPDRADAHTNLGVALCDKHDLEGAIIEFRIVVKLKPEDADGHKNLGVALRMKGDLEEATAELKKAADLKKGPEE